jgi:hypothetical protein
MNPIITLPITTTGTYLSTTKSASRHLNNYCLMTLIRLTTADLTP